MLKKIAHITGTLVVPLQVGRHAIIRCHGDVIRTSLVVEILKETADYACFETMNSIYKVSLSTVPAEAYSPCVLRMVA